MKNSLIFKFLIFVVLNCVSQQLHSPAEIIKIMADSKLNYEIKLDERKYDCEDKSTKLNYNNSYRQLNDGQMVVLNYEPNEKVTMDLKKAEKFFEVNKSDSARYYYEKALKNDSSLYYLMTYIGQIYGQKGDFDNAIKWYKMAIQNNYIDYMAHWFLADTYFSLNDTEKALEEIIVAHILNRNNPRIKSSMFRIFEKSKLKTDDWTFCPQFEMTKDKKGAINLVMAGNWMGYAMAKAIWAHEPGYRESMGVSDGNYSSLEERECLVSLAVSLENSKAKIKNDPQLKLLKTALDKKYLDAYAIYEVMLTNVPQLAFQLDESNVKYIRDYLIEVRYKK